ncbi:MAG: hypothetical protein BGO70_14725 [Bacteroidetes bacterium 43-93]|nr:MAG: hypothetical protein BGO70_14725 [Bacteroidetes bacterium 43-93]
MRIYKVNLQDQLRSARPNLLLLGIFIVIGIIVGVNAQWYLSLEFVIPVFLILGLPAVILHIIYWRYNKGMIISIQNDEINIQTKASFYRYKLTDIILAEKIINGSPVAKENSSRQLVENYGYIKLGMKDGSMFYLTSLMLDPEKFDIITTDTVYSLFPIPNKRNYKQKQRLLEQEKDFDERDKETAVSMFVEQFKSMDDERLQEKLILAKNYRPEAIEAVKRILAQRKTTSI